MKHGIHAGQKIAQEMREVAKSMLCPYLHQEQLHSDCALETEAGSDEVY